MLLRVHLAKTRAALLLSRLIQLTSNKLKYTARVWTSSTKLSSLQGIRCLGALTASMQFADSLSTPTWCIFNQLAKIIGQWIASASTWIGTLVSTFFTLANNKAPLQSLATTATYVELSPTATSQFSFKVPLTRLPPSPRHTAWRPKVGITWHAPMFQK